MQQADNPKVCIYVLGFNDASMEQAEQCFANRTIFRPCMIPSQIYLEGIMYKSLLMERLAEWEGADYVGTLAYKAPSKTNNPHMAVKLEERLGEVMREDPDVVVFFCFPREHIVLQAERYHPGFTKLWSVVMTRLGYEASDYDNRDIKPFFGNYWMAKPQWMKDYIEFYKRVEVLLETDEEIKEMVMRDAGYQGGNISKETCLAIFGRPYYTFHCFLCERMCCFFFWKQGAKIKDMTVLR